MEGRLPGARCVGSPTGGWKPPLLQPTAGNVNSELHRLRQGQRVRWPRPTKPRHFFADFCFMYSSESWRR